MKRAFFLLFGLLLIATGTVLAQEDLSDWTAWVYTPDNGTVTIVRSNQAIVVDFEIPLPDGITDYPLDVQVSPDSTLIGYVVDSDDGLLLVVTEWITETVYTFPVASDNPESVDFAFHTSAETLELGQMLYHPTWRIPLDIVNYPDREKQIAVSYFDGEQWRLQVYDADSDSALFSSDAVLADISTLTLLDYRDSQLIFSADDTIYMLNIEDDSLMELQLTQARTEASDYLYSTGDTLFIEDNVLYLQESDNDEPVSLYEGQSLSNPRFVQDGEYIALIDSILLLIDRDSTVLMPGFGPPGNFVTQLVSTPDGLLLDVKNHYLW